MGTMKPEVELLSEKNVDYTRLRNLLAEGKWKEADQETLIVMLKAAGREKRGWLNPKSIETFPCADLHTIDRLWEKYSDGRFGFSVQKRIWESVGGKPGEYDDDKNYYKFGDRVGWRVLCEWLYCSQNAPEREERMVYSSQNAPEGHLPACCLCLPGTSGWLSAAGLGCAALFFRVETCNI